jgi:xanthine dehydrogenase iron-sulfur cluster and FAD-binding subunit A
VLRSLSGERSLAAEKFFLGTLETAARSDELLTAIHIPLSPPNRRWGFEEMSQRQGDYALVAVAATFNVDDGICVRTHLAYSGVESHTLRIPAAEAALNGKSPGDAAFAEAAENAAQASNPIEDVHADYVRRSNNFLSVHFFFLKCLLVQTMINTLQPQNSDGFTGVIARMNHWSPDLTNKLCCGGGDPRAGDFGRTGQAGIAR